jgi:hypothetical protein
MNAARIYLELVTSPAYSTFAGGVNQIAKFILDSGREFAPGPLTYKGRKKRARQCFMNATQAAFDDPRGLRYAEGFMTIHGVPIHHAWNVDRDGNLIDLTIRDGLEHHYFGVEFANDYLLESMHANGVYGLLDGYHNKHTIVDLVEGRAEWRPT